MQIFRQALNLWEQLENERGMANAYNNMGIIYDYRGQFDKSVEQYSQALELRRTIHDTIGLADAYNNLSVVYHYRGLYQQALEKYQQAEDLDGVAYIYDNVGLVYQRQEQYDDALASFEDSLKIRLEMGISQRDIGSTYANTASIYMEKAEYETALRYDSLALGIFEDTKDQYRITSTVNNMGIVLGKLGNIDEAIVLGEEMGSKEYLTHAYRNASRYQEENGDFQQSLVYQREYSALKDTLSRKEYSSMADMFACYESEKKAKEIELQQAQLSQKETYIRYQQTLIWSISTGLILFMVTAVLSYRMYRSLHRAWKVASDQKAETERKPHCWKRPTTK